MTPPPLSFGKKTTKMTKVLKVVMEPDCPVPATKVSVSTVHCFKETPGAETFHSQEINVLS